LARQRLQKLIGLGSGWNSPFRWCRLPPAQPGAARPPRRL